MNSEWSYYPRLVHGLSTGKDVQVRMFVAWMDHGWIIHRLSRSRYFLQGLGMIAGVD